MDPAIVGSPQFGFLFKTLLPGTFLVNNQNVPEQIFSQPLVYTGSDGVQYVYIATTQNNIYKMNAKTGAIVASRNLHRPFLVSDLDGCTDINPTIGVTATGVIDPSTDTWYLTAKTYLDQSASGARGKPNGRYYFHAISTTDLTERPNFPVDLEGSAARNNPSRGFGAGIHHQRPGLLQHGQYIYAGFASHCAQYNFTGWIFGWDKSSGKIVEQFTTEGAGVGPTVPGGGVWMSGGGLTSDDKGSMFFATGNGYASQLSNIPVNGRNPPPALEEAAVHMAINDDGSLRVIDFFMPWEKPQLDGADKDLGTTPLEMLPSQFQCGNVKRMGVVTGKSGKTYWLDLDNLGGYQNGPNKLDNVIQVTQNENSVYAGAGVYPMEGGYIYINVIQYPTHVYKFSCNNGVASFNWVADSPEKNAYVLGVGHGTTTSLDGQPGTGLLWTSDVEGANLRIYDAVPSGGKLNLRNSFVTPGTTKFSRPVFGDGIVYQGTNQGYIYAYGSPVNLPVNCSSLQFASTNLNQTSAPQAVQCLANTAMTINAASIAGNPNFVLSGLPTLPYQLTQGQVLSFQAVFAPKSVGPLSSAVVLNTTQQTQGYSTSTQVLLRGTGQSQAALLQIAPNTISFNSYITGQDIAGVNQSFTISNVGNSTLQISSILFSTSSAAGPWVAPNGTANAKTVSAFTFYSLPSSILANQGVSVPVNFNPSQSGSYVVFVQINSNGGSTVLNAVASGSDQPKALIEFETPMGTWVPYSNGTTFSFGNVTENTSRNLRLRISNKGTANAAPISLTVSKPPFGIPGSIIGANNQVDLAEGSLISAGQNATATLYCSPPKSQFNVNAYTGNATWTINLNDPTFGKQQLKFACNAVSEQVGPLNPGTQQATYRYAGCFKENDPGRQLQTQIYSSDTANNNSACISQCAASGYIFAATQYRAQCWCGYNRPKTLVTDDNCNFPCTGDSNQICGGNGVNGGGAFLSTFGDIARWNGNSTDTPGPYINPGALGFQSLGCYTEGSGVRALTVQPNSNNTILGCLSACVGYKYSGVEYGGQCFCGNSLGAGSVSASASDCSMTCNNNQTEYCGGPSRLNMYASGSLPSSSSSANPSSTGSTLTSNFASTATSISSSQTTTTTVAIPGTPTPVPSALSFRYVDCYSEGSGTRALADKATASSSMTAEICASFCTGYQYMATEYSSECYCGNTLLGGSAVVTDGRCSMTCSGNSGTICGGPNGLSLYQFAPPSSSSTTSSLAGTTSVISTSVTSRVSTVNATSSMTIMTSHFPVYYHVSHCYIIELTILPERSFVSRNIISKRNPYALVELSDLTCNYSQHTDHSGIHHTHNHCHHHHRYLTNLNSTIPLPSPRLLRRALNRRTLLPSGMTSSSTMNATVCATFCNSKNLPLFGLEYSRECYCGSSLPSTSTPLSTNASSAAAGCNMACSGSASQICGGSGKVSVYNNTLVVPPRLKATVGPDGWGYKGCFVDSGPRTLGGASFVNATSMTQELCVAGCKSRGFKMAGVEYAQECYCADALKDGVQVAGMGDCEGMLCKGDASEYCGAGGRIAVWGA
ncbi:putative fungistatic metabolite [Cyphellophora attinorum]|uniref:Putative fungistatic metabolite n=1 Tax=Cyphellophora attinorum TaxID=1664694 RepID=A0A0N1HV13_9EURO|nr:putative fungistatic metabolite [Phialophora attinorum]KPI43427.1 putative fungistatic metabolite [Phialophora attinorum]